MAELGERINTDNYRLKSLTRACRLHNDVIVHKLPITKGVLKLLLDGVKNIFGAEQPYLLAMYLALFSTAYHGLFRIGEIASGPHVILAKNVHIGENKNKMLFILQSSKTHGKGNKPQLVKITSKPMQGKKKERENTYCPFNLLKIYINLRPPAVREDEQFFVFSDGSAVRQPNVRNVLSHALKAADLNPHAYVFHALCLGHATDLLALRLSVETIKKIGRWRSNAVFTYLRN